MVSLESRSGSAVKMLLGNKADSPLEKREVPMERARLFAAQHQMLFMETSAYAGTNVEEAFMMLATTVLRASTSLPTSPTVATGAPPVKVDHQQTKSTSSSSDCPC
jgi:hypothetical protein